MSAIFPAPIQLRTRDMRPQVTPEGTGLLMLGQSSFVSVTTALDARLMAVGLLELATQMETAQRAKGAAA